MPERSYFISLTSTDRIRVRLEVDRGEVLSFVVQYETWAGGDYRPVARYDTAHSQPHRDVIRLDGEVILKDWLPSHWTLARCLTYAQNDLRRHWRTYRAMSLDRE